MKLDLGYACLAVIAHKLYASHQKANDVNFFVMARELNIDH